VCDPREPGPGRRLASFSFFFFFFLFVLFFFFLFFSFCRHLGVVFSFRQVGNSTAVVTHLAILLCVDIQRLTICSLVRGSINTAAKPRIAPLSWVGLDQCGGRQ